MRDHLRVPLLDVGRRRATLTLVDRRLRVGGRATVQIEVVAPGNSEPALSLVNPTRRQDLLTRRQLKGDLGGFLGGDRGEASRDGSTMLATSSEDLRAPMLHVVEWSVLQPMNGESGRVIRELVSRERSRRRGRRDLDTRT